MKYNWNEILDHLESLESSIDKVWTNDNAGINLKGGLPRIDFYPSDLPGNQNGRIALGSSFLIQSNGKNLDIDAWINNIKLSASKHLINA